MKRWIKVQLPQIMEPKVSVENTPTGKKVIYSAFPKRSLIRWSNSVYDLRGDKSKWDSASIDLTFSQGHGGSRGQMEGLNKSSVTAGA